MWGLTVAVGAGWVEAKGGKIGTTVRITIKKNLKKRKKYNKK